MSGNCGDSYHIEWSRATFIVAAGFLLAQCGGGSRSVAPQAPQPLDAVAAPAAPLGTKSAPLTFRIAIPLPSRPRRPRSPHYITAATRSIKIDLTVPSLGSTTTNVSPGTAPCGIDPENASDYLCTISIHVPAGNDALTVSAYDAANATGNLISAQRANLTVELGQANTLSLTLDANATVADVTPPNGVTLSGGGCPAAPIAGSSDISATCTATFASTGAASFTIAALDAHGSTVPAGVPGAPVLSASSSDTTNFTVSAVSNGAVTITPQAAASAGSGATSKIGITVSPANSSGTAPGDGLSAFTLAFTVAAPPAAAYQNMFVPNYGTNTVTEYPVAANGNVSPTATLAGANTGLNGPVYVAFDASGKEYVANQSGNSITVYAAGATGNASPVATIAGPNTLIDAPQSVILDGSGKIYVTNSNSSVTTFAAGANGNATPVATISGANTGLDEPVGEAFDSSGHLYVTNGYANSVTEYASGANGNVSPIATLAGSNTQMDNPLDVTFDSSGRLFVTNAGSNAITIYAAGASGNASPVAGISGSNTGLDFPEVAVFNTNGAIFVANNNNNSITVYAAGATGNATPTATISGTNTGLNAPSCVTLH
jgi:hypothetical protein